MNINYKKIHKYLVDVVLLLVASYFILRKTTDVSGSEIIESVFQPKAGGVIINAMVVIVAYSLIARLFIYTRGYFKRVEIPNLCFPHYRCLLNNNKEIEKHITELMKGNLILDKLDERHSYEENLQIIHRNFSEHLLATLKEKNIGQNDIFLSLFHDNNFSLEFDKLNEYHYSSHYDPTLHDTSTSLLKIKKSKVKQKDFAGIRAIKKKAPVICPKVDDGYDIGGVERRLTVKHYIGIPLKIDGHVVGLLNIEFHNKSIFSSAEEMKSFYQKEIQAFIYLYEYQLHKKYFFKHLKERVVMA